MAKALGMIDSKELYLNTIKGLLTAAFKKACRTDEDRHDFIKGILDTIRELALDGTEPEPAPAPPLETVPLLPAKAPSLWLERTDRAQTPAEFIKNVYAEWLGKGLTQAHIRRLDRSLYMALHKWLQTNDMPADLDLPTQKQMNDRLLEAAGLPSDPRNLGEQDHEILRLHLVAHARAHRASP